jgi:predicted RNA-binding protein with PUA-like domain
VKPLKRFLTLDELKQQPALADMMVLRKGNRLSITPVEKVHWDYIMDLAST